MSQKNLRIVTRSRIPGQSLDNHTLHRRSQSLKQIVRFDSKAIPDEPSKKLILKQIKQKDHIKIGQKEDAQQMEQQQQQQPIIYDKINKQQQQQQQSQLQQQQQQQQQYQLQQQQQQQQQQLQQQQQQQQQQFQQQQYSQQQQEQILSEFNEAQEICQQGQNYALSLQQINFNNKLNKFLLLNKEYYLHMAGQCICTTCDCGSCKCQYQIYQYEIGSQQSSNYSETFKPLQKFDQYIPKISYPTSYTLHQPTIDNKTSSQDALPKREFDTVSNLSQETSKSIRSGSIQVVGGAELQKITQYNMDYQFKIEKLNPNFTAYANIPLMDMPLSNKTSNREQFKLFNVNFNNKNSIISARPKQMVDIIPKNLLIKTSTTSEQFQKFENVQRQLPGIRGPSQKQVYYPSFSNSQHFKTMNSLQFPKRDQKICPNRKQSLTDRYTDNQFEQQQKLIENI